MTNMYQCHKSHFKLLARHQEVNAAYKQLLQQLVLSRGSEFIWAKLELLRKYAVKQKPVIVAKQAQVAD